MNFEDMSREELLDTVYVLHDKVKHLGREYGKASDRIADLRGRIARADNYEGGYTKGRFISFFTRNN